MEKPNRSRLQHRTALPGAETAANLPQMPDLDQRDPQGKRGRHLTAIDHGPGAETCSLGAARFRLLEIQYTVIFSLSFPHLTAEPNAATDKDQNLTPPYKNSPADCSCNGFVDENNISEEESGFRKLEK